jgi:hypothetical protein
MTWIWIGSLVVVCAVIGGYVYLVEYRVSSALGPAPADNDEDLARMAWLIGTGPAAAASIVTTA